jgi:hypothetical protein
MTESMPQEATTNTERLSPARTDTSRRTWTLIATTVLWVFIVYLGMVLPLDSRFPMVNHLPVAGLLIVSALAVAYLVARAVSHRGRTATRAERLKSVVLLCSVLLACFLIVDIGSAVYFNLSPRYRGGPDMFAGRDADAISWTPELMPHIYYPTAGNFFVYKPSQVRSGYTYGEDYSPAFLRHKVLADCVFLLKKLEFVIDEFGFRNTHPPEDAHVFTLGDSFCFGYGVTQNKVFEEILTEEWGEPVYNLGVSATSPWQQYLTLEWVLKKYPGAFRPKRLLWFVFEGNDLEEDYSPVRPAPPEVQSFASKAFRKTIIDPLGSLPTAIRQQSLVRTITTGQVTFGKGAKRQAADHFVFEGDRLPYPVYHSSKFGYRLFRPVYLERATKPESYVRNHPNAPRLRETFQKMRVLSNKHGFEVTVVIVPQEARVYKDAFDDFPPVTKEPYFIRYISELSKDAGFRTIDLNQSLEPYAKHEMLYQRDDTHWNERGHQVVAEILAEAIHGEAAAGPMKHTSGARPHRHPQQQHDQHRL